MRVLYFIDSLGPGGAQRQLVTLLGALDRDLVEPSVAVYHPLDHFRPDVESLSVPLHEVGARGGKDPMIVPRLRSLIRRDRVDIVHAYLRSPGVLARLAGAGSRRTRIIVSERSVDLARRRGMVTAERILANSADAMIVNARVIAGNVERLVPSWKGRIHVVPNGIVWTPPGEDDRRAAETFRSEHVEEADVLLGVVARVEVEKRPGLLLDSLERLPSSIRGRLRVVWVGARNDRVLADSLRSRIERGGLGDVFSFVPPTRHIRSVYMALDALVLCSAYEGLPNVVLEALAHGVPVIATDVGDTADVLKEGVHGWLVPREAADDLADAIATCVAVGPEKRAAMGERGARYVLDQYSAAALARRTMNVYAKVLGYDCLGESGD